ncbi:MAG: sigma-70 family RNA polymerase sigma factor [Labilithrix sp.]|nr:sigma-70 family RNA polymerase sigma factor [Labilithrix sp.]
MNVDSPERRDDAAAVVEASGPAPPGLDFLAVYEELFPFVWRLARRRGVPEAALDDVCQDVFVIVHKRLAEFEGRSSLKTWVYGILNNVILTRRRTTMRRDPGRAEIDPELLVDGSSRPDDAATGAEAARIARALLAQLGEDKRAIFVLVELEGMTVPEAAEAAQINLNTAYARLRAARAEFATAVARFQAKERRA